MLSHQPNLPRQLLPLMWVGGVRWCWGTRQQNTIDGQRTSKGHRIINIHKLFRYFWQRTHFSRPHHHRGPRSQSQNYSQLKDNKSELMWPFLPHPHTQFNANMAHCCRTIRSEQKYFASTFWRLLYCVCVTPLNWSPFSYSLRLNHPQGSAPRQAEQTTVR